MKIVIVGLGLIGGSIAKALKQNTSHQVLGMDTDQDSLLDACSCGAIDGKASAYTPVGPWTLPGSTARS